MQVQFDALSGSVEFSDADAVVSCLLGVLRGWSTPPQQPSPTPLGASSIRVIGDAKGFVLTSPRLARAVRFRHPVDAVCALIVELAWAYLNDRPDLLCLHGAAVSINGRLVVFPNRYRAGKSVLAASLASAGDLHFADDILPLDPADEHGNSVAIALGFAPRLRLPLPDDLPPAAASFIDSRLGAASKRYLYLDLGANELAPLGTRAPIGAIVLLDRADMTEAVLEPAPPGDVLRHVIWQNFARTGRSEAILQRLRDLVARVPCFQLRYDHAGQAIELLQQTFDRWDLPPAETCATQRVVPDASSSDAMTPMAAGMLRQRPGITETTLDGEHFLADADGIAIHHLNAMAAMVWRLLSAPTAFEEIATLLRAAFPDVAETDIRQDLSALIVALGEKGLLLGNYEAARARTR